MRDTELAGYKITEDGKLWSEKSNKFLKPATDHRGYAFFHIGGRNMRLHRLVALAFIPNPSNLRYVNHKDYDKQNNKASNLEWCDASTNMLHSYTKGRKPNQGNGKFKPKDILEIRELYDAGVPVNRIAAITNSSWDTINKIAKRQSWLNV